MSDSRLPPPARKPRFFLERPETHASRRLFRHGAETTVAAPFRTYPIDAARQVPGFLRKPNTSAHREKPPCRSLALVQGNRFRPASLPPPRARRHTPAACRAASCATTPRASPKTFPRPPHYRHGCRSARPPEKRGLRSASVGQALFVHDFSLLFSSQATRYTKISLSRSAAPSKQHDIMFFSRSPFLMHKSSFILSYLLLFFLFTFPHSFFIILYFTLILYSHSMQSCK